MVLSYITEVYLEPSRMPTIFQKISIVDVRLGPKYTSVLFQTLSNMRCNKWCEYDVFS